MNKKRTPGVPTLRDRIFMVLAALPPGEYRDAAQLFQSTAVHPYAADKEVISKHLSNMYNTKSKPVTRIPTNRPGTNAQFAYAAVPEHKRNNAASVTPINTNIIKPAPYKAPHLEVKVKPVEATPERRETITLNRASDTRPQVTITDNTISVVSSKYKLTIELP